MASYPGVPGVSHFIAQHEIRRLAAPGRAQAVVRALGLLWYRLVEEESIALLHHRSVIHVRVKGRHRLHI